ncbi:MAG: hypothetical protein Kow0074_04770 [Candidatus Zixiibacteriota bacterium]
MPDKKQTPSTPASRSRGSSRAAKSSVKTARKPAPKRCSVNFTIFAPHARSVDVAGSFNGWELKPLKKGKDGTWKVNVRPKPGRYEYKFLVDHQWITDPANPESNIDPNGNVNSVITLE